ncbi:MAG: class IV adenylate cyclase [Gemmatimonadetes bacterium]|nr:class IV adenylate cyclase [Gemmatimonadota bacterium]
MREIELKGVVPDPEAARRALLASGARCTFAGGLIDWRYDLPDRRLRVRDEVLRLRVTRAADGSESARLDFKGPTSYPDGFKVREEIGTDVQDAATMHAILLGLGYVISREIEREVEVYEWEGVVVRLEQYPRLDVLAEVEGDPAGIEQAIACMGLARASFTVERLSDFARRFESRTGQRAALSARELSGDYSYRLDDA